MINEETIVSVYDDKMTLLQFLKSVNKALDEAVLTSVEISKKGNATLSFVFDFADGTKIESGEIVLQQGESVTDANIVDGHLYLTLSNDERLDAGNVKPVTRFEINASQHLIVYYGDGTSQDLGAILQGNVNIDGTITANIVDGAKVTGDEIVEKMTGYNYYSEFDTTSPITPKYVGAVKNGNKLTIAFGGLINIPTNFEYNRFVSLGAFYIIVPADVWNKIIPLGASDNPSALECKIISGFNTFEQKIDINAFTQKTTSYANSLFIRFYGTDNQSIVNNKDYAFRYEITFLLSDNMMA